MKDLRQVKIDLAVQRNLFTNKTEVFESAIEKREVDSAKEIQEELEAIQTKIAELEERLKELEADADKEDETEEQEDEQEEAEENSSEESTENRNLEDIKGEDGQMENRQILDGESVEVRAFDKYLETRDITEDGLTSGDAGYVVVPSEENEKIIELADDIVKLRQFVTTKPVSNASGTQPVRTTAKAKLSTVKELEESPAIGVTPFMEVDYKVSTKRGYIPYSEEYVQDGVGLVNDLRQFIGEVVVNTENDDILAELNTVRGKTVNTVDALKTLVNTGFSAGKGNRIKFLVSQSVFDNLDRLKDHNGRYLLQESIANETGYKLLGKDVIVLDDEYFPNKTTMFVGDLSEIIYFDRAQTQVSWTTYLHYGECLGVAIRNDVGKLEDDKTKVNIYKVTVNIPTETETTPEA